MKECLCGCGELIPERNRNGPIFYKVHHCKKGLWWYDGKPHTTLGKKRPDASIRMKNNNPTKKVSVNIRFINQWKEYKIWKGLIEKRDINCVICNESDKSKLDCHHIESIKEIIKKYEIKTVDDALNCDILWDIKNGIILCRRCHMKTDGRLDDLKKFSWKSDR